MTIINMTPHDICIMKGEIQQVIPASGALARCEIIRVPSGAIDDIPLYEISYGAVEGLPAPKDDTVYLVSTVVAQHITEERRDVLVPTDFVRDDGGNIIGCKALSHIKAAQSMIK